MKSKCLVKPNGVSLEEEEEEGVALQFKEVVVPEFSIGLDKMELSFHLKAKGELVGHSDGVGEGEGKGGRGQWTCRAWSGSHNGGWGISRMGSLLHSTSQDTTAHEPTASPYTADNCLVVVALSYRRQRGLPGSFPGVLLAHCLVAYFYETRTQERVYPSIKTCVP